MTELAGMVTDAAEKCGYPRPEIELEEQDIVLWAGMNSSRFINATGWSPRIELQQTIISLIRG